MNARTLVLVGIVLLASLARLLPHPPNFTPVAAVAPKATVEPTVKKVPVMVTDVPPPDGPEVGLIDVTAGGADVR